MWIRIGTCSCKYFRTNFRLSNPPSRSGARMADGTEELKRIFLRLWYDSIHSAFLFDLKWFNGDCCEIEKKKLLFRYFCNQKWVKLFSFKTRREGDAINNFLAAYNIFFTICFSSKMWCNWTFEILQSYLSDTICVCVESIPN